MRPRHGIVFLEHKEWTVDTNPSPTRLTDWRLVIPTKVRYISRSTSFFLFFFLKTNNKNFEQKKNLNTCPFTFLLLLFLVLTELRSTLTLCWKTDVNQLRKFVFYVFCTPFLCCQVPNCVAPWDLATRRTRGITDGIYSKNRGPSAKIRRSGAQRPK